MELFQIKSLLFSIYCAKEALKVINHFYKKYVNDAENVIKSLENYLKNPTSENKSIVANYINYFALQSEKQSGKAFHSACSVIIESGYTIFEPLPFDEEILEKKYSSLYNLLSLEYAFDSLTDINTLKDKAIKESVKYAKPNTILDFFDTKSSNFNYTNKLGSDDIDNINYKKISDILFYLYCAKKVLPLIRKHYPMYIVDAKNVLSSIEDYLKNPIKELKSKILSNTNTLKANTDSNKTFMMIIDAVKAINVIIEAGYLSSLSNYDNTKFYSSIYYLNNRFMQKHRILIDIEELENKANEDAIKYYKPNIILDLFNSKDIDKLSSWRNLTCIF
jgi:hypothetical protein